MTGRTASERRAYREAIHAYLLTPAWKARSKRYRAKHGPDCQACGGRTWPGFPMHVHHRSYARAFKGREPDADLRGLCPDCHRRVHDWARRGMTLAAATDAVIRAGRRARGLDRGVWRRLLRLLTGL